MSIQTLACSPPEIYSFPMAESPEERFGLARDKVISCLLGRFAMNYDGDMPAVVSVPTSNEYSIVVDAYARQTSELVRDVPEAGYVIYAAEKEYRKDALTAGLPTLSDDVWQMYPYDTWESYEAQYDAHREWFTNNDDSAASFAYIKAMRTIRSEDEFLSKVALESMQVCSSTAAAEKPIEKVSNSRLISIGSKILKVTRAAV